MYYFFHNYYVYFYINIISLILIGEFGIVYQGVLEEHNANETKIHAVAIKTLKGVI